MILIHEDGRRVGTTEAARFLQTLRESPVPILQPPTIAWPTMNQQIIRQFLRDEGIPARFITNLGGLVVSLPTACELPIHPGQRRIPSYLGATG